MPLSDEALQQHLLTLAQGDEQALQALYAALSGKVYAIALRMLESKEEAQEVVQDTFIRRVLVDDLPKLSQKRRMQIYENPHPPRQVYHL